MRIIKLTEQVRAAILEELRRSNEPLTVLEMCETAALRGCFDGAAADYAMVEHLVRNLHNRGALRRVHIARPRQRSRFAYELVDANDILTPTCAKVVPSVSVSEGVADVKVAALKSGALRIAFRGLCVEISVE